MNYLGNKEILKSYKIALFCSQNCPPAIITRIYDYAIKLRDEGKTVISGFHTRMERDVLKFLLEGKQPIIICPARSLKNMRIKPELKPAFDEGRILFLSTFKENQNRITSELSHKRNLFIAKIADEIFVAHASKGGSVEKMLSQIKRNNKKFIDFIF